MIKPTILCKLTPDAVALLQLIKARSIDFEKMGELVNGDVEHGVKLNGHVTPAEARRRPRFDAGRTTINGITVRSYRKGSKHMARDAVLTTGQSAPTHKINGGLLDAFKTVQGEMTKNEALGLPTVSREVATKALTKKQPGLSKSAISGEISYLFKHGYLREVVSKNGPVASA